MPLATAAVVVLSSPYGYAAIGMIYALNAFDRASENVTIIIAARG